MALRKREPARFLESTDPIRYFMENDSLRGLGEVSLTFLSHYHCNVGCEICYLKDRWQPIKTLLANSSDFTADTLRENYLNVNKHFHDIEIFDDVMVLRKFFPKLYEDFGSLTSNLIASSVTDNLILRFAKDIDLLPYKGMYQITITDTYLLKHELKLLKAIKTITDKLGKVRVIRIIAEHNQLSSDLRMEQAIRNLHCYADCVNTINNMHITAVRTEDPAANLPFDRVDDNVHTEGENFYFINNNCVYCCNGHYYFTMEELIKPNPADAFTTTAANAETFISDYLIGKIALYQKYAGQLQDHTTPFYQYFKAVGERIKINPDYNFIPFFMINWNFKIFDALLDLGWTKVPQGIIRKDATVIKPLVVT